jgi:tRNA(Ile)-lysidine synthase
MPTFIEHVRQVIARYRMLTAEDQVLVGVSGGADSVATALVLRELGWRIGLAHLNHGLRGAASDEDEAFVRKLAADWQVPIFTRYVNVAESGDNLEAAGRDARRLFFSELRTQGYTRIALGHNREDRIETFLLHLLRGAGPQGLTSMAPVAGNIIRPLLESTRAEIEAYLLERGQVWRVDATNNDMSFARNRLRHDIIPRLGSLFNTRLPDTLSRTILVLTDEDQLLSQWTNAWMAQHVARGENGVRVSAEALRQESPALTRRVVRASLEWAGSTLTDVTFDQIEKVRTLLEPGQSGKTIQFPGAILVIREFDQVVVRRKLAETSDFQYTLRIPDSIHIPEIGRSFRASLVERGGSAPPDAVLIDAGRLRSDVVEIRNWRAGDYYRPVGVAAAKVKKLFQKARIPRHMRKSWPILAHGSELVWVVSFPVSRDYAATTKSEKIVAFEALPD